MPNENKTETKLCKHCQSEIPKKAKVCPQCRKKQKGGILKWIVIGIVVLAIISAAAGGGGSKKSAPAKKADATTQEAPKKETADIPATQEVQEEAPAEAAETEPETETVEYISVTADELVDALDSNAMKAQNDYKNQYLEISGKLGTIDSNGAYIDVDSNKDFDFTSIQCYLKTDEHKDVIMNKTKGDPVVVRGYCKDVGEFLGYSIDVDNVE